MSIVSKYDSAFKDFQQRYNKEIGSIGKILGKGAFSEVREIKYKNKAMAVKIMEKTEDDKLNGEKLATNLQNHNIIKSKEYMKMKSSKILIVVNIVEKGKEQKHRKKLMIL